MNVSESDYLLICHDQFVEAEKVFHCLKEKRGIAKPTYVNLFQVVGLSYGAMDDMRRTRLEFYSVSAFWQKAVVRTISHRRQIYLWEGYRSASARITPCSFLSVGHNLQMTMTHWNGYRLSTGMYIIFSPNFWAVTVLKSASLKNNQSVRAFKTEDYGCRSCAIHKSHNISVLSGCGIWMNPHCQPSSTLGARSGSRPLRDCAALFE